MAEVGETKNWGQLCRVLHDYINSQRLSCPRKMFSPVLCSQNISVKCSHKYCFEITRLKFHQLGWRLSSSIEFLWV